MDFIQKFTGKGPLTGSGVNKLNDMVDYQNNDRTATGDDFITAHIATHGGKNHSFNFEQFLPFIAKLKPTTYVTNNSGSNVPMCGILTTLDNATPNPSGGGAALAAFQIVPTLDGGSVPSMGGGYAGYFVIAAAPIASGKTGPCWASGLAVCKVDIQNVMDDFADLNAGSNTSLISGNVGAAQIISNPSGATGTQWCIVRLANLWPAGAVFQVGLTSDGTGSLGNDTTKSSWKYYMKDLNGNYIGAAGSGGGVSPKVGRINGTYAAASIGLCYYDENNTANLLIAYELPGTTHC